MEQSSTYDDDLTYCCKLCPSVFSCLSSLKDHENCSHTLKDLLEDKIYSCHGSQNENLDAAILNSRKCSYKKIKPDFHNVCERQFQSSTISNTNSDNDEEADETLLENEQYSCKVCNRQFSYVASLKYHKCLIKTKKADSIYVCQEQQLPNTSVSVINSDYHLQTHKAPPSNEEQYICKICQTSFSNAVNFEHHSCLLNEENSNSGNSEQQLPNISLAISEVNNGYLPQTVETSCLNDRPYVCKICQTPFADITYLNYHTCLDYGENSDNNKEQYVCEICNRQFAYVASLKYHKCSNTNNIVDSIKVCHEQFPNIPVSVINSDHHLQTVKALPSNDEQYICKICQMSFSNTAYFKDHSCLLNEENSDSFNDSQQNLPNIFISEINNSYLPPTVETISVNNSQYVCKICQMSFSDAAYFKDHNCLLNTENSDSFNDSQQNLPNIFISEINNSYLPPTVETISVNDSQYVCKICQLSFTDIAYLNYHTCFGNGENTESNNFCQQQLQNSSVVELNNDNQILTDKMPPCVNDKKYVCIICHKDFSWASSLKNHNCAPSKETEKTVQVSYCEVCETLFHDPKILKDHYRKKHKCVKLYSCNCCQIVFLSETAFLKHNLCHVSRKSNKQRRAYALVYAPSSSLNKRGTEKDVQVSFCEVCQMLFSGPHSLKQHYDNSHIGAKIYSCEYCKKQFAYVASLKYHQCKFLNGGSVGECNDTCEEENETITENNDELNPNVCDTLSSSVKEYACKFCNVSYGSNTELQEHALSHRYRKLYKCEICKKKFATKSSVSYHKQIVHLKSVFTCDVCQKKLSTKANLENHILIHGGEKPYTCNICERGFIRLHNFKTHHRRHKLGRI